ncbi:alpha/beta hydrolase [Paracoccus sp. MBLB3053]|uniref:Alpha/beta hydrolase n=1 Tax=Paracoccus aurantius TaxID=3073814 RepID=A0ABU2HUQ3_9RHOB|nr:alpha/beta hydrolase [Paracoccus sp. MBLB3053]MDS9468781.1 alpha/beta hydrolase [Paracoccus sp. MBLB3053]
MLSRRSHSYSRRMALTIAGGVLAAPALGQECGKPLEGHVKGPRIWRDYDQVELDAAYRQEAYQPNLDVVARRLSAESYDLRLRRGYPQRASYGEPQVEQLDLYKAEATGAPIFVFIHGGTWRFMDASSSGFAAEPFLDRGAHFVALDFSDVRQVAGDLGRLADQVRRGIAWVIRNAESFGGDPGKVYIGGHSSGGHLAAVALTTDWTAYDLPDDAVKGGLCMSGMYDLAPVRLSWRRSYISFTDRMEDEMSPQRHLDQIMAPVVVTYGTLETPEFQRQATEFADALGAAGKQVTLLQGPYLYHDETRATLGNPYGMNGRAALALMGL